METANALPENAAAFAEEAGVTPVVNEPVDAKVSAKASTQKFYTEDDLAKARSQEKEKLYPQIEELKSKLSTIEKEREEKAAMKAAKAAEEAALKEAQEKAKLEEDLDTKELLKLKEQEWNQRLEQEKRERQLAVETLQKERAFSEFQNYKMQQVEAARENIIPELVDLISGATPEEVDASIAALTERSARILESVQQASQTARREMVGTRPTLPSTGPLDDNSVSRQFTAEDIAAMSMNDYAKYRQQLLSPTAQGKTSGLFG